MITLNNINLSSINLSGIDLVGIKLGLGGRGSSGDGFPVLPGDVTRWHFGGLTNEMMAAMDDPRIEDADGKGRFLSFKNFLWAGMSGVNGYVENYNGGRWVRSTNRADMTWTSYSVNITSVKIASTQLYYQSYPEQPSFIVSSYMIRVQGLKDGQTLSYRHQVSGEQNIYRIIEDGIYTLPSFLFKANGDWYGFQFNKVQESCNITIEQLPLYPGALVFDGVDDYGICENFPILTKEKGYTVVALRQYLEGSSVVHGLISNTKNWFTNGAFVVEYYSKNNNYLNNPVSFGAIGSTLPSPNIFTYQTSTKYNGTQIKTGNFEATDLLIVGGARLNGYNANVAIWEIVILDHDATEEELQKIQNYYKQEYPWLFPDQAWTVTGKTNEDTDRATIANITGNGNNLVLSNFGFAENSGYGLYPFNIPSSLSEGQPYGTLYFTTEKSYASTVKSATYIKIKFKVRGLQEGFKFFIRAISVESGQTVSVSQYEKDGVYEFEYDNPDDIARIVLYNGSSTSAMSDFYVDIIPEYEGYLVTDGVDDRIQSSNFPMGKDFTIVGEWKFIIDENKSCGLMKPSSFYLFNEKNGLKLFIKNLEEGSSLNTKSLKAICSDGRVYFNDWSEMRITKEQNTTSGTPELSIAFNGNKYTQIAFKNLGIYNGVILSKDECIKAYNYLQTLKAK